MLVLSFENRLEVDDVIIIGPALKFLIKLLTQGTFFEEMCKELKVTSNQHIQASTVNIIIAYKTVTKRNILEG